MDEELLAEFLTESNENLSSIEEELLKLEADPGNAETLGAIFRVIHTVKGNCGFLGLQGLEKVAHAGENLLGKIRSKGYHVDGDMVSLLLENSDAIKTLIAGLEENGVEPVLDFSDLCVRLSAAERLIDLDGAASSEQQEAASDQLDSVAAEDVSDALAWLEGLSENAQALLAGAGFSTPESVLDAGFEQLRNIDGLKPAEALKILGLAKSRKISKEKTAEPESIVEVQETVELQEQAESEPEPPQPVPEKSEPEEVTAPVAVQREQEKPVKATRKPSAESSIRVDVALLDELMNQVGELVLSRNRLLRLVGQSEQSDLVRTCRNISQTTTLLQEKLLHTRMQPISTLWSTVPRLLRDIGKQLGKKINVKMDGQETELDRTILAAMKDPMTHIIRNSCDHGIELPALRQQKGKSEEGTISLSARQESGFIMIDIHDDGGGIPADKIRNKAVSMHVITEEQASKMSDKAALQLIFHAGLSTAEQVSNLSGRGVGMDVVRSEIEGVGGTVEIDSELGSGTTLHIRIPLTLAIIPALIVSSSEQHFAIPQMMVQELISIVPASDDWEYVAGRSFYRLRGRLLPIQFLSDALGLQASDGEKCTVVVINVGEHQFGIGVDGILGAEEIVVKPLGLHFQHLDLYGGCSILGDGMVVPILDCVGLTKELRQGHDAEIIKADREDVTAAASEDSQYILVFSLGDKWYAIPMALVERIEEILPDSIEASGRREVLQYRDQVIPVLRLAELLDVEPIEQGEIEPCLIIADQGRRLCIQVDEIVDIVQQKLEIHLDSSEDCFLGTAVIDGRSTEVIDIFEVIKKAIPNWFNSSGDRRKRQQRILYVEDAIFYRNLVLPALEGLGCEILLARNGLEAQEILSHHKPDLILTDLEMPEVNGFELAEWVRTQPAIASLPVVSLSSLEPSDIGARSELFQACVKKFEREVLLDELTRLLGRKPRDKGVAKAVIDAEVVNHDAIAGGGE
ncbi:two-component system, chemotaxis family, sensor kinase CheA [Mariprofundus micogutta]|uniref:Chemotaxis protein CheA n=1 Tax=Mariprofundus micogutta TaxID=1921010 RepID=A0A1L8CNS1_9PROT|nr:chemotaxis protein CheW [Mariprofundus micogutta]GAV20533.1 two-component system, chemotaxis family, sensor kinase CheA [Mariprofundus micogutta]